MNSQTQCNDKGQKNNIELRASDRVNNPLVKRWGWKEPEAKNPEGVQVSQMGSP